MRSWPLHDRICTACVQVAVSGTGCVTDTCGEPVLIDRISADGVVTKTEFLGLGAATELAASIRRARRSYVLRSNAHRVHEFKAIVSHGVEASVAGRRALGTR